MNKYGKISIVSAALAIPLGLLASISMSWTLKSRNVANINVSSEITYLTEILATLMIAFSLILLVSLVTGVIGRKKDDNSEFAKLGLILVLIISIVGIGLLSFNSLYNKASDPQKIDNLQKIFDSTQ